MITSYKQIKNYIQKLWPNCRNIWLSDLEYEFPTRDQLESVIARDHTERLDMRGYQFDCDDFALQLSAAVNLYHGQQDQRSEAPWPFGQIMGRKFKGKKQSHTCNICVLEDGVLLIEPQTDEIWEADPDDDDPYFIKVP